MIKIAFDLDDDNVRYMLTEGDGKPLCGTVPMNDQFKAIYQLCKDMHETERRIQQTLNDNKDLLQGGKHEKHSRRSE